MTNDTGAMWKDVHAETQRRRDRAEAKYEACLARAVARGELDARPLGEYGWTVWAVGQPDRTVEYWPRTGALAFRGTVRKVGPHNGWRLLNAILEGHEPNRKGHR